LLRAGFLLIAENAVLATTSLCASCVRPVNLAAALSAILAVGTVDNLAQGAFNLERGTHDDDRQVCSLRKTRLAHQMRHNCLRAF
jgi:hypothetical protein